MPFVFEKGNKLVVMEMLPTSFMNNIWKGKQGAMNGGYYVRGVVDTRCGSPPGRDSIIGSTYCERLVLSTRLNQLVTT